MRKFRDFLVYIYTNLTTGKYNLGILMILTIAIFAVLLCETLLGSAVAELLIGTAICISYSNFEYDARNKR